MPRLLTPVEVEGNTFGKIVITVTTKILTIMDFIFSPDTVALDCVPLFHNQTQQSPLGIAILQRYPYRLSKKQYYERGPIFWTGKLMVIYQLVRRIHETHTAPYFHGRI
jgi:hypothetical protein